LYGIFNVNGAEGIMEVDLVDGLYVDILSGNKVNVKNKQMEAPKDVLVLEFQGEMKLKKLYCESLDYTGYQTW
jgi:uncharacterized protein YrrD